jgi:tetratricopeptide (TPR) repeat protein
LPLRSEWGNFPSAAFVTQKCRWIQENLLSEFQRSGTSNLSEKKKINPTHPLDAARAQLQEADRLRRQGQLNRARSICESLIGRHPGYMAALDMLGLLHAEQGKFSRALECLVQAVMLDPHSSPTRTALAQVYWKLGAREMAVETLEQAIRIKPKDPVNFLTLAGVYHDAREFELAADACRKALALDSSLLAAASLLGHSCSALGRYDEAEEAFAGVFRDGRYALEALYQLSQIPTPVAHIDVLAEVEKLDKSKCEDQAEFETVTAFIRAAGLDRAGRHAQAWENLVAAHRALIPANREPLRVVKERQYSSLERLRRRPIQAGSRNGAGSGQPVSLFIFAPSRSGKTTMESLLASLDGVKRGYENPIVDRAVRRTFQTAGYPAGHWFEQLPPAVWPLCRDLYIDELTRRAGSAKVFTNTDPILIHDSALMATVFPNVRFLLMKRNVEDNMLRIYMTRHQGADNYAYDLNSIREHIAWYHQMMDVLAEKFPDITRIVHYEDMIANPAAALRIAAELCGLDVVDRPLPALGDDRGCGAPYRQIMAAELEH